MTTKFTTDLSSGYAQVLKAEKDSEVTYYTRGFELISKTINGESVFYLYDGGSSVRALTDESGAVTVKCALDRIFDDAVVYMIQGESYRGKNLETYSITTAVNRH